MIEKPVHLKADEGHTAKFRTSLEPSKPCQLKILNNQGSILHKERGRTKKNDEKYNQNVFYPDLYIVFSWLFKIVF